MNETSHPDQHHVCSFYGHVRPGPDGDAHVSHGQSRRVIHAVSHHGHYLTRLLQLLHLGYFVGGKNLSKHCPDAHLKKKTFVCK